MSAIEEFAAGVGACDSASTLVNFEGLSLSFRDMDSCSPAFLGMDLEKYGQLLVEDIPSTSLALPVSSRLVMAPNFEDGVGFLEAIGPMTQDNKEAVVSLLECFADSNCSRVVACVNKTNPQLKHIVSSFLAAGFSGATSPSSSNYLWLMMDL